MVSTIDGGGVSLVSCEKVGMRPVLNDQHLCIVNKDEKRKMIRRMGTYWSNANAPQNVAALTVLSSSVSSLSLPTGSMCNPISIANRID